VRVFVGGRNTPDALLVGHRECLPVVSAHWRLRTHGALAHWRMILRLHDDGPVLSAHPGLTSL
jgi:hypothetical protein